MDKQGTERAQHLKIVENFYGMTIERFYLKWNGNANIYRIKTKNSNISLARIPEEPFAQCFRWNVLFPKLQFWYDYMIILMIDSCLKVGLHSLDSSDQGFPLNISLFSQATIKNYYSTCIKG